MSDTENQTELEVQADVPEGENQAGQVEGQEDKPDQPEERQETEAEKRARKERNRAIREKYRAEAEAKHLKERLEDLERRVSSQGRAEQPAKLAPEQFNTPEEYEQAILDAKVEAKVAETLKREREQARISAEQAQERQARESFAKKAAEAQEVYSDFDEVVASAAHVPIAPVVERAIMKAPNGPDLVYHLAKNPEELERINRLHPVEAAFEIAALSMKVTRPTTKASKAPEPVKPVTAARSAPAGEPESEAEWLAWRTKQVRNQR